MKTTLIFSLLLIICVLVAAEEELRPYRLINTDELYIDWVGNEYYTRLIGNVHFFYGDTEFFADTAEMFDNQKIARMIGNVMVIEDSLRLTANRAEYNQISEQLILTGDTFIREEHFDNTERTFQADRAHYLRDERKLYAFENVEMYDQREDVKASAHYLEYELNEGYGFLSNNPNIEIGGETPLTISAERIEFYRDISRLTASFNVTTSYTEYLIESDFLMLFSEEDYAVFLGEPKLTSEVADASAERIYVYFDERKIKSATLENDSFVRFAVREGGEKSSTINSNLINLTFADEQLTEMEAVEDVKSLYVSDSQSSGDVFRNYAESERLIVTFGDNNEITGVSFIGRVRGNYVFSDDLMGGRE